MIVSEFVGWLELLVLLGGFMVVVDYVVDIVNGLDGFVVEFVVQVVDDDFECVGIDVVVFMIECVYECFVWYLMVGVVYKFKQQLVFVWCEFDDLVFLCYVFL